MKPRFLRIVNRPLGIVAAVFIFSTFVFALIASKHKFRRPRVHLPGQIWHSQSPKPASGFKTQNWDNSAKTKTNILLPTTKTTVNFCKTLLTMTILDYPKPEVVAWGENDVSKGLKGGGSHYAKITSVLDWLNDEKRRKQPGFDDELVFMLDSFDVWFQLPFETLISRYYDTVAEENKRVAHRMGRAHRAEGISSTIVFGGGKRCAPNELHTIACYPVPDSPLPMDTHGGQTDNLIGRNGWTNFRTRYLNSGYVIGPVGMMRPLLERAKMKLDECIERRGAWFDDGSGQSNNCYHGSDQSIFVEMFGEQEFHREIMRRHHRSAMDDVLDKFIPDRAGAKPPTIYLQGAEVADPTNPDFAHQVNNTSYQPGKPFEFGIAIDYWSLLGHQSANAEHDYRYLKHNEPLEPQIGKQSMFDCKAKAPMAPDLPHGQVPFLSDKPNSWETMPLFSEICVGTIPVMIHHNSPDKSARERYWDRTWWHGRSRRLMEEKRKAGSPILTQGLVADTGETLRWETLCPISVEKELYRDIE